MSDLVSREMGLMRILDDHGRAIAVLDNKLLWIALGGAGGSVARYLIALTVQRASNLFPLGTMTVNVVGSLLIGFLFTRLEASVLPAHYRMAILVGFLGAFTTFSTFSLETLMLLEKRETGAAFLNIGGSLIVCLLACWAGRKIALGLAS